MLDGVQIWWFKVQLKDSQINKWQKLPIPIKKYFKMHTLQGAFSEAL